MPTLKCQQCQKDFFRSTSKANAAIKLGYKSQCCSLECKRLLANKRVSIPCAQCSTICIKEQSELRKSKSGLSFCCHSCSALYTNSHKTIGTRISKLELWLQTKLTELYPKLTILYNDRLTINSELDIYIPELKLAFELNGIFHYEPIYGPDKLRQIQNNDNRKFQACLERGISLCIIDTTIQKRFTEQNSYKFLHIIQTVVAGTGLEPALLSF